MAGLLDDPGTSVSDLSRRLDLAKSTVSYHLDRLREAGAVERQEEGGSVRYRVPEPVRGRLDRVADGVASAG